MRPGRDPFRILKPTYGDDNHGHTSNAHQIGLGFQRYCPCGEMWTGSRVLMAGKRTGMGTRYAETQERRHKTGVFSFSPRASGSHSIYSSSPQFHPLQVMLAYPIATANHPAPHARQQPITPSWLCLPVKMPVASALVEPIEACLTWQRSTPIPRMYTNHANHKLASGYLCIEAHKLL